MLLKKIYIIYIKILIKLDLIEVVDFVLLKHPPKNISKMKIVPKTANIKKIIK